MDGLYVSRGLIRGYVAPPTGSGPAMGVTVGVGIRDAYYHGRAGNAENTRTAFSQKVVFLRGGSPRPSNRWLVNARVVIRLRRQCFQPRAVPVARVRAYCAGRAGARARAFFLNAST